jgi:hypothetical protein
VNWLTVFLPIPPLYFTFDSDTLDAYLFFLSDPWQLLAFQAGSDLANWPGMYYADFSW